MSDKYKEAEDYENAVKYLEGIRLVSLNREITDLERAETNVKIAQYWFESDDSIRAEMYLNKATTVIDLINMPKPLTTAYKYCKAKVLDSKR